MIVVALLMLLHIVMESVSVCKVLWPCQWLHFIWMDTEWVYFPMHDAHLYNVDYCMTEQGMLVNSANEGVSNNTKQLE